MHLLSPAFASRTAIPVRFTCDGANVSPALTWDEAPEGTRALALVADDPDAPLRTWVHWVLYDLPPAGSALAEGVPAEGTLPSGARQGRNDFGRIGYGGPCPPPGPPHRYRFTLYALDAPLTLGAGATRAQLSRAMRGHVLDTAELVARYGRTEATSRAG
jgi:Raf kinase inhibitor-like YbhB/YbcL family protein